jgi:hypothetical protein
MLVNGLQQGENEDAHSGHQVRNRQCKMVNVPPNLDPSNLTEKVTAGHNTALTSGSSNDFVHHP